MEVGLARNQFLAYIRGRKWSGEHRDFANDAIRDDELPDATSWEQLETYLRDLHALDGAIIAGKHVWECYQFEVLGKKD